MRPEGFAEASSFVRILLCASNDDNPFGIGKRLGEVDMPSFLMFTLPLDPWIAAFVRYSVGIDELQLRLLSVFQR